MSDNIYKKWPPVSNAELLGKLKEAEQKKAPAPADQNVQAPELQGGHAVGYKRPPLHTRFKPGVSGNPRGRRKRVTNIKHDIQQVFLRDIEVQDGMTKQHVPSIVLLFRRLLNDGIKGDKRAAAMAAKMAEKFDVYDYAEKNEIDFSGLTAEENELLSRAGRIISRLRGR